MVRVFGEAERGYVDEVLASGILGHRQGGMVTRFEQAFAQLVGSRYGIARNSAMTALAQAVSVSGAGTGFEVLCDPIVHFGAVAALYFNAVPRFVDVRRDTYLMDPQAVRANITPRTRALIVTNLWGLCAELDELRRLCDAHGLFMIEDCAHNVGSSWKGKHAGTYGDVGVFSFQQSKHLSTGDGGMITTDRAELHEQLHTGWAFGGESPPFLLLNFRMNEVTAAVGLGQVQRVMGYVEGYTRHLRVLNEAIAGCAWLRARPVPAAAQQCGYIWACTWEGDAHGLDYARFKQLCAEIGLSLRFGFTGAPAYQFDLFKGSTAYGVPDCPVRCPFYTAESDYRYRPGLCPVAEDLMPRLITYGLVERADDAVARTAELLRDAIRRAER
ncbi:MAG TPA: DegT/DnrJ/EryC1/StrS family aminotransferase [Chloroflexota bacterium]|nr:DegT/DnrJ/EryC1/StrS family aminotransferase [Chloroflexota bacterium]